MDFFIAIDRRSLPSFSPETLESLTPRIMQWNDDIWILDMGLCLSYWWNRALQDGLDVVTLWRLVLQRSFGGDTLTYSAAVAPHPWLAVLVLGRLHQDAPEQRTAMAQALFRFSSFHSKSASDDRDIVLGVVAWEVVVTEKMALPPHVRSLFDDPTGDMQQLATLENLLPVPLERLDVRPDWVPESSFGLAMDIQAKATGVARMAHLDKSGGDRQALVYQSAALERPLFIFERPETLARRGESGGVRFLERTMEKWWLHCKGADERPSETVSPLRCPSYYDLLDGLSRKEPLSPLWPDQSLLHRRQMVRAAARLCLDRNFGDTAVVNLPSSPVQDRRNQHVQSRRDAGISVDC